MERQISSRFTVVSKFIVPLITWAFVLLFVLPYFIRKGRSSDVQGQDKPGRGASNPWTGRPRPSNPALGVKSEIRGPAARGPVRQPLERSACRSRVPPLCLSAIDRSLGAMGRGFGGETRRLCRGRLGRILGQTTC